MSRHLTLVTRDRNRRRTDANLQLRNYICSGNIKALESLIALDRQLARRGKLSGVADNVAVDKSTGTGWPDITSDASLEQPRTGRRNDSQPDSGDEP